MSLREDFHDLAYKLAKVANQKKKRIKKRAISTMNYYKKETDKKIRQDLKKLEDRMMHNELYELNIHESDRITQINKAVADKKIECIQKFIELIKDKINKNIEENPDAYYDFLVNKLSDFLPLIDQDIKTYVNKRDLKLLNERAGFDIVSPDRTFDTTAGFKIEAEDNSFEIDYTVESQIERFKKELSIRFMKIFPVFEVDIKSAIEVEKDKHGENKKNE